MPTLGVMAHGRLELAGIHAPGQIRSVYQPIADLRSGDTVGYEALARRPRGSEQESPVALFVAARTEDRLGGARLDLPGKRPHGAVDAGLLRAHRRPRHRGAERAVR